jgi:hypothetical protein
MFDHHYAGTSWLNGFWIRAPTYRSSESAGSQKVELRDETAAALLLPLAQHRAAVRPLDPGGRASVRR